MTELRYAVLAENPATWEAMTAAKAWAAIKQVPVLDLVAPCRRMWGIIERDLEKSAAAALAQSLSQNGLAVFAIPNSLLVEPAVAQEVHHLALSTEGLIATISGQPPRQASWTEILVIAAAAIKEVSTKTIKVTEEIDLGKKALGLGLSLATGIPMGLGGGKKEAEKTLATSDVGFWLDIVLADARWRVNAAHFDFSGLKELKDFSTAVNFRVLALELARQATVARKNRGLEALTNAKPLRDLGHESLADLDKECAWLLTLATLKRP